MLVNEVLSRPLRDRKAVAPETRGLPRPAKQAEAPR